MRPYLNLPHGGMTYAGLAVRKLRRYKERAARGGSPTPSPGPGEVLIEVHAASINPADVKNVQGSFPQTKLPRIPGRDLAGVVVAGDDAMKGVQVWASGGDIGFTRDGSHAEYIVVPKKGARRKPSSLSMEEAASVGTNYITAYLGLIKKAALKEGETVLVTGASGGVGSSVIKMAKTKAARVIAVDKKPPDKAGLSGIDLALGSDTDDVAKRVMYFTDGRGADVAFDCVGGPLFEPSLNSLGRDGRQINITAVGERRVTFDLLDFYRKAAHSFWRQHGPPRHHCIGRSPRRPDGRFRRPQAHCAAHRKDVLSIGGSAGVRRRRERCGRRKSGHTTQDIGASARRETCGPAFYGQAAPTA